MTKTKRILALLLALLLATGTLLGLASCDFGGDKDNESDPAESTADSESETEGTTAAKPLELVKDGKTDFVIIVPTDSDLFTQDMVDAVNNLIGALKNYTGATIEYKDDFVGWDAEPDDAAYEILIGGTNRKQSAAAIEGMGVSEYVIKADGNKLVINGVGFSAIVSAINYFTENMIKDNKALGYGNTSATFIFGPENDYYKKSRFNIKSIKINGVDIADCQIIYPEGGYAEEYFGILLKKHIATYAGIDVPVVSDKTATAKQGILIGKTNRTTITAEEGKYNMEVTDKGLEVVTNDVFSYISVNVKFQSEVFKYVTANIELTKGQKWSGASRAPANLKNDSDLRIMYHNVWGYLNADIEARPNYTANRLKVATAIYAEYMPDIIGFQEMKKDREHIESWLIANGYEQRVDYSGNPIWFNTNTLECLGSGSCKKPSGGYNTMWCLFRVKATGKVIGVTDSHFTANSMVSDGDAVRQLDAQALLDAVDAIKAKAAELGLTDIPIITGGDYNTNTTSAAYQMLIDGGLTNARDVASVTASNSCFHDAYTYDPVYGIFMMPAEPSASADAAIDHIMVGGNKNAITVDEYAVVSDRLTASTSDHAPQFVDISFK